MILSTKQHETAHRWFLMLFSFLLPLHPRLSILVIFFLGFNWLLSGEISSNFKQLLKPLPLLFFAFYGIHLLALIYTSNWTEGIQKIETKLPLLVFPLILFSFPLTTRKFSDLTLKSFVGGCLLASFYCTSMAWIKYLETGENWMHYKNLGSFLGFHPTYFSIYISFALFIVLFFLAKKGKTMKFKQKAANVFLTSWFFLFILLLSSRMTILATSLTLGITFLVWMYSKQKLLQGIIISLVAIIGLFFLGKNLPGLKIRTKVTVERVEKQNKNQGVSDPRVNLWKAAWKVIKKNPFLGTGTGDAQDELVKVYEIENYEKELSGNFNAHNQFLQTTVALGIVGGLVLLFYLLYPFWEGLRKEDYLYLMFLSLVILSFLTESFLQTQRGTLFFGFFHSFFTMRILNKKDSFLAKPQN